MHPLGVENVLNASALNVGSMWLASLTLFRYGIIANRVTVSAKTCVSRIEAIEKVYPVFEGQKALGCVVHETNQFRGYHLIGDDRDLANFWYDLFIQKSATRGFEVRSKAMSWTANVPGTVFIPYVDIDERGTHEQDLHRVLIERVLPMLDLICSKLQILCDCDTLPSYQVFFGFRRLEDGLFKFSFHIHWFTCGIENINDWKSILKDLELPRHLNWTKHDDGKWVVKEDENKAFIDMSVYGGRNQLFRGPYCGKKGEYNTVLYPVTIMLADDGKFRCFPDGSKPPVEMILRARIARHPKGLMMLSGGSSAPRLVHREPSRQVLDTRQDDAMLPFLTPLLKYAILPAWQKFRSRLMLSLSNVKGAVVPTEHIQIVKNVPHSRKQGVRHLVVGGDTFCIKDPTHCHTKSPKSVGITIDFVHCKIKQSCFACESSSDWYTFLQIGNEVEIREEKDSRFTNLGHWSSVQNPHQFLLDYFPDYFRFHRLTQLVWVYDESTRIWKCGESGSVIVGKLIDKVNRDYAAYIQAKKKIVVDSQIAVYERQNPSATREAVEEFCEKIFSDARKFVQEHLQIVKVTPAARSKILGELRSFTVHREVQEFNVFPHLIPMRNRMYVNVFTCETGDIAAEHYFTSVVDAEMLPESHPDLQEMRDWFFEVCSGCKEKCLYLMRLSGYFFTFLIHDRKFYVLKGSGKNAKGLYKAFVTNILNGPEGSEPRWKSLKQNFWEKKGSHSESPEAPSPEAYELMNKALYYSDDMDRVSIDACKVKRIVAGEPQSARTLFAKPIQVKPRGKILWTTNFFPDGPGNDNAYWERFVLMLFNTKYVQDTKDVDEKQWRFLQNEVKYKNLLEKTDAFFTVAVLELFRYYRSLPFDHSLQQPLNLAAFPIPQQVVDATIEARETQLPLAAFIREHTTPALYPMEFVTIELLFTNYIQFLENINEKRARNETTQSSFVRLLSAALDIECNKTHVQKTKLTKPVHAVKPVETSFFN